MRFWTSDHHFGHTNIIEFTGRPFYKTVVDSPSLGIGKVEVPDVDAMNTALIDNWNSVVSRSDEVWVVGDFALGSIKSTLQVTRHLHGHKFLVPGNHDRVHKMHPKWRKFVGLYTDVGFRIMDSQETVTIADQQVLVCHFPYTDDNHYDGRYSGLRPEDTGKWLIHGHTHSTQRVKDKMIHVGVDAWDLHPVPEDVIEEIISTDHKDHKDHKDYQE